MKELYERGSANYPRLRTDMLFSDYENDYTYWGYMDEAIRHIEGVQMLDPSLWKRFVDQFREKSDCDGSWRGEFWGKLMRGAALTYSYTKNPELYRQLVQTVEDMLTTQEADGRISTYSQETEFTAWDLWCRKYVLLGMQYFLEICQSEELKRRVIHSMCRQVDYIIQFVGSEKEGKKPIANTGVLIYRGANSASILEPIVRLYSLTEEQKYLDFATYLVDAGVLDVANLYKLAFENQFKPYQYPVTKAYEVISCFEGLVEYYRITGEPWQKTAAENFGKLLLENEFTVTGSAGCTFEFFDHSTVRQADPDVDLAQETCVTVTMMKYFYQLLLLTGDPKYADAFEISLYNAYFGAFNSEEKVNEKMLRDYPDAYPDVFPFDSYSSLTNGLRGKQVGGLRKFSDGHCYGCCAAIGAAGNGLIPKVQLLTSRDGYAMNLYINGTVTVHSDGGDITFVTKTDYPRSGLIRFAVNPEKPVEFVLSLRIPAWSENTKLTVNGQEIPVIKGYTRIRRTWTPGDMLELRLDMRTRVIRPIPYGSQILVNKPCWKANYIATTYDVENPEAKKHIALQRGPLVLAQDARLGYDVSAPAQLRIREDGYIDTEMVAEQADFPHMLLVRVSRLDGTEMELVDYASAGKTWTDSSRMAAWIRQA